LHVNDLNTKLQGFAVQFVLMFGNIKAVEGTLKFVTEILTVALLMLAKPTKLRD
jgi:hypothetical protein